MNSQEFFVDFIENSSRYAMDFSELDYETKVAIHGFIDGIIDNSKGRLDKGDLVMAMLAGYSLKIHRDKQSLERLGGEFNVD